MPFTTSSKMVSSYHVPLDSLNPLINYASNNGGAVFSTVIDHSDNWLYVSSEQSSPTASVAANGFHTLKIDANGMLSEPFAPTVLPVTSNPAVRVQGITVF